MKFYGRVGSFFILLGAQLDLKEPSVSTHTERTGEIGNVPPAEEGAPESRQRHEIPLGPHSQRGR